MARIEGRERILARLLALPKAARAEMRKAIDRSAAEHLALARQLAPKEQGELAGSIHIEAGAHELQVLVVADAPHALHQEFGTRRMPANPFMSPAYRLVRRRGRGRIKRALNKAVKDSRRGG